MKTHLYVALRRGFPQPDHGLQVPLHGGRWPHACFASGSYLAEDWDRISFKDSPTRRRDRRDDEIAFGEGDDDQTMVTNAIPGCFSEIHRKKRPSRDLLRLRDRDCAPHQHNLRFPGLLSRPNVDPPSTPRHPSSSNHFQERLIHLIQA